ncbi:hypothetical protein PYH37_006043 (plasmid) [Sinorhizobium numidicum]|uniref:Nodulation protein n=1 Tax=Sinorhizobium numidicum TaxID=680248 RepID=A0ABY8D3D6_9HYPH|nr:hypothetical protein [Sinorhizobium numidicum]WEX79651.1 hypothetical protein PYH37_006043 [Sinorhizobium numidicum]WEX85395.1 hypothetical protein PYH38_006342 [Sinorhizobium numidicum]
MVKAQKSPLKLSKNSFSSQSHVINRREQLMHAFEAQKMVHSIFESAAGAGMEMTLNTIGTLRANTAAGHES